MNSSLSRIEQKFIFNFLKMNKVYLEIKVDDNSIDARIIDFNNTEIKIELKEACPGLDKDVKIKGFFYFQNNHHVFDSLILKTQRNIAIIQNPESVAKSLQRRYERVIVDGKYQVTFKVEGEILPLNYPVSKLSYFPEKAPVNADFSNVKINNIIQRFRNKLANILSDTKIVMLRNSQIDSFLEEMVIDYGRILYIPKTHAELTFKSEQVQLDLLKKDDWIDFEIKKNQTNPTYINKVVSSHLLNLKQNKIYSQAIIPVLYRNYVIALIYLINKLDNPYPIELKLVDYAYQFSRILSFALKYNGYFKEEEGKANRFNIPIYDLSPGGLAFFADHDHLEDKILLDHNIILELNIDHKTITVLSKIVRKFSKLSNYYYGCVFLDIKNQDYHFLKDKLY